MRLPTLQSIQLALFGGFLSRNAAAPAAEPPAQVAVLEPPAVEPAEHLRPTSLGHLFAPNGAFLFRSVFRFNVLSELVLAQRREILTRFTTCTTGEFYALPFAARKAAFQLVKREFQRYKGTAVALGDSSTRRRGEPLPKLTFRVADDTTPEGNLANRRAAVAYRELLEQAMRHLASCTRTEDPTR